MEFIPRVGHCSDHWNLRRSIKARTANSPSNRSLESENITRVDRDIARCCLTGHGMELRHKQTHKHQKHELNFHCFSAHGWMDLLEKRGGSLKSSKPPLRAYRGQACLFGVCREDVVLASGLAVGSAPCSWRGLWAVAV